MTGSCANPNCYVSDGELCSIGHPNESRCQHWNSDVVENENETEPEALETNSSARVTWSGSALGGADLINLTPKGRSILIGVMGAENSGKTTFLVGNYLLLLSGKKIPNKQFAGSVTLGAWEALASWMRFDSSSSIASFPPHTPRGTERVPGLLHLALKNDNEECRDVLLTDAPGEWFTSWSINENAIDAEGAKWVVKHSDAFIIFADCAKLSGDERGQARQDLRQLIERLGNHLKNRPAILVWAKSEQQPPERIMAAIRKALNEHIQNYCEIEITVENPDSLTMAFSSIIDKGWTPPLTSAIAEPVYNHSPFTAFRGHHAKA
ncbi:TRAFAC clade GTPase domain-containing protein [Shewanella vaxholmensis]|uniref:TRAFAC clade GTPase domain-containing protein n=1 Tax=Shewanella vaxholmensis TaxID=3063535 RepID=UPI00319A9D58